MNIFVVDAFPDVAAEMLCDQHVVKMVTESAQMLSTAHRILDGELYHEITSKGHRVRRYRLSDDREDILYKAVHFNHPCNIWIREATANYRWLFDHYVALAHEYFFRYDNNSHKAFENKLVGKLSAFPKNLQKGPHTEWPMAMKNHTECIVENNPVQSYRNFYRADKASFATWNKKREAPWWWTTNKIGIYDVNELTRKGF